jgi:hypothetical protein
LRLAPVASRNAATVNPSGDSDSNRAATRCSGVDGVGVEVHAVPGHDVAATNEFTQLGTVDVVGLRRGESTGPHDIEVGMVGVGVDDVRGPHRRGVDDDRVERGQHGPFAVVERGQVEAGRSRSGDAFDERVAHRGEGFLGRQPLSDGRLDAFTGELLDVVGRDPPPLAHDPLDRSIGCRP